MILYDIDNNVFGWPFSGSTYMKILLRKGLRAPGIMPEAPAANLITDRPAGAVPISKLQVASAGRLTTRNRCDRYDSPPERALGKPFSTFQSPRATLARAL